MVPEICLLSHADRIETSTESDLRMRLVEHSIGCERCHGPGQTHVQQQTAGALPGGEPDRSIVNPRHLFRDLSEAVCRQCHLQGDIHVPGRASRPAEYRPGLALEGFRIEFRLRRQDQGMTVVGHVEQLAQSACYRGSETMTCVTCHDP